MGFLQAWHLRLEFADDGARKLTLVPNLLAEQFHVIFEFLEDFGFSYNFLVGELVVVHFYLISIQLRIEIRNFWLAVNSRIFDGLDQLRNDLSYPGLKS